MKLLNAQLIEDDEELLPSPNAAVNLFSGVAMELDDPDRVLFENRYDWYVDQRADDDEDDDDGERPVFYPNLQRWPKRDEYGDWVNPDDYRIGEDYTVAPGGDSVVDVTSLTLPLETTVVEELLP